ncbi:uncharacterized protein LOC114327987 [Diabrotica virgifera virgifera]|uniref:Caspase family p20 domain-containing protein n=1 Tax=Diabrotica virgifera virgifera TaxID=50390 RepID=A0ABM5JJ59_DIAVI|nr:uncharacterized protein LOC114327987 [Diabrotica virgifera virgifera]XP_050497974.1 uncharacterized protein LOC114327987 [Diabrotica virgifera virgifera]
MARSNRSSAYEEEIEVHPSTELIPDEYEHFGNQPKFLVHTFFKDTEADKDNEKDFLKTLSEIGITCKDEDRHNLDQEKIFEILNRIKENCSDDTTGLIMYFSGMVKQHQGILHTKLPSNDISIQKIWLEFNSFNCFKLKNKPKIFIYDLKVYAPPTQRDARRFSVQSLTISAYDTPSEADILVICNKDTEEDDSQFTLQFCNNIKSDGDKENIITLASCVGSLTSPIIISTLTRHFYFTPSELRGHHLVIHKDQQQLKEHVEDIHNLMKNNKLVEHKKKHGILDSFREVFRKSDANKSTSPSTSATVSDGPPSESNKPPSSQQKRPSGPSSTRSRKMSQSEPEGSRSSTKRPPWR